MSRWGEEEKKSKGLFGCIFAFLVLGFTLYTFILNYKNLEGRRDLEKGMQDTVRKGGYAKSEIQLVSEILNISEELGLEVAREQIELSKTYDDYNNPVVDVYIDFSFTVDLLLFDFEVSLPIAEKLTIVVF